MANAKPEKAITLHTAQKNSERAKSTDVTEQERDEAALVEQFARLFIGYEEAHGLHELKGEPDENGKIKGRAQTLRPGATLVEYRAHLEGSGQSLGLIPLLRDNTCWFAAIDIDIQGITHLKEPIEKLEKRIRKLGLPLVVCRSKSGGVHVYLLAETPIPAKLVRDILSKFAAWLGYGGCEVFPKQIMRVNENDRGNWINLPYYGVLSPEGTQRYAIRNGKPIANLKEFLEYCEMMRISSTELEEVQVPMSELFSDGPPCLQHLATLGIESGARNTTLSNIAVYFKKSLPGEWEDALVEFNVKHVSPPLSQREVDSIRKSYSRKDYSYTCKNPPLSSYCDKQACSKRAYGIGTSKKGESDMFTIDNLTKCVSRESVRWYAEHQGLRIELTTDELLSPRMLQKAYVERFSELLIAGKAKEWHARLKELIETCDTVEDPEDASEQGQFENMLFNYFTGSRPARNRDELIKGSAFIEGGRIYFRSEDLFLYLTIRKFHYEPHKIWQWLKEMGAESMRMSIKGVDIRVWSLPEPPHFDGTAVHMDIGEL
jgi:hypothetical protein